MLCFAVICTAGFSFGMGGIMLSVYIENAHVHSVLALIPYSALGKGKGTVSLFITCSLVFDRNPNKIFDRNALKL